MRKVFLPLAFAIAAFCLGPALAKPPQPVFVRPSEIHAAYMLPPPPADNSLTNKVEIDELHAIERTRTPADIAHARADERERDIFIFKTVLGKRFNAKALPLTARLSDDVEADERADIETAKKLFPRTRPYNFDKTLHPVCRTKIKNDSYPSGHAMTGYLMALVLSSMLPEERGAIFARADDYAHNRLVCGVHHASDIEAGKLLAYALFAVMEDKPRFQAERAAAEAEIRKVLNLPTENDP